MQWEVATTTLPGADDLYLGLSSDTVLGAGFSKLTFELFKQGTAIVDKVFTTVASANSYFTDDLQNLGLWDSGVSGSLDLQAALTEVASGAGNGYGIDLGLAIAPPPAAPAVAFLRSLGGGGVVVPEALVLAPVGHPAWA